VEKSRNPRRRRCASPLPHLALLALAASPLPAASGPSPPPARAAETAATNTSLQPADRPHPFLFVSAEEIARARERIERDPKARAAWERMLARGEKDLAVALPKFETAWWSEAKKKPWGKIYPQIARHTFFIPAPPMAAARRLALLGLLSGRERFIRRAREILLHYTDYSFAFEHYDVGMNYSIWGVAALDVYDMLYGRFDEAERRRINAFFRRFLEAVMKNDRFWVENEPGGRFNNHYTFHKQAIAAVGLFFGRDDLAKYAIESREGVRDLMENAVLDNGLWIEGSLHYHFTALWGLAETAEMFRHAGGPIDLYRAKFRGGKSLKQLFDAPFGFVFPDGLVPNIGDTYGRELYLQNISLYRYAYNAYRDPRYAWLLSRKGPPAKSETDFERDRADLLLGGRTGEATTPSVRSVVFPRHGYVLLRVPQGTAYWKGRGWCAFLTFDKAGTHSHLDKLGLILWGRGRLLAQDVEGRATEGHAFSSDIQRRLNRKTLCSNTVVVDGRDQRSPPRLLRLVEFSATSDTARATIADEEGLLYKGVRQQRTVIVRPDYVLDVFRVASAQRHAYDWTLHPLDEKGLTRTNLDLAPIAPDQSPAPRWIGNGRGGAADRTWWGEWSERGVAFRLTMAGSRGTEVRLWDFPRDDKFHPPPIPMLQVRRRARATDFVALYQAGAAKNLAPVAIETSQGADGSLAVVVALGGRKERWVIPALSRR